MVDEKAEIEKQKQLKLKKRQQMLKKQLQEYHMAKMEKKRQQLIFEQERLQNQKAKEKEALNNKHKFYDQIKQEYQTSRLPEIQQAIA